LKNNFFEIIYRKSIALYRWGDEKSDGALDILNTTFKSFTDKHAVQSAAGLAFYTLFSLFPLLLVVVSISSNFLDISILQRELLNWSNEIFPLSQDFISRNIQSLLDRRSAVGGLAVIALLWSSTTVFFMLISSINRAWVNVNRRSYVKRRLFAMGILGSMVILLAVSAAVDTGLDILARYQLPYVSFNLYETPFWQLGAILIPVILKFVMLFVLYSWIPNTRVRTSATIWGAAVALLLMQWTTAGFSWYLRSGWARYDLIYGSLGTVIVLMLWVYLTMIVILFGAYLTASIDIAGDRAEALSIRSNPEKTIPNQGS
jgi:membrane protein